ncbi:MAG TPA: hypothetical protein VHN59_20095 [Chitinophagaceae bacterium]|nr:hypothetical protein [Chitinophagaceae bacterium]
MRKTFLFAVAAAFIFMACHRKTVPTVADRTEIPAAPAKPAEAVASAADIEAGHAIFTTKCSKCHATKPVDKWTVEGWQPILKAMIPKARLDSVQAAQVTAYVKANAKRG